MALLRRLRPLLLALPLLVALPACGGDTGAAPGGGAPAPGGEAATGADPAPTGDGPVAGAGSTSDEVDPDREPDPSPGCSGGTPRPGGPVELEVRAGGLDRKARLVLPPGYDAVSPMPLVFDLHAFLGRAATQLQVSEFGELVGADGAAVVAPQGRGITAYWNVSRLPELADDVRFLEAVLDELEASYCIDRARVYAAGFDMGGQLALQAACQLPDRIAAVGVVGGPFLPEPCEVDRPLPVMLFHGTDDRIYRYEGGLGPGMFELPAGPEAEAVLQGTTIPGAEQFAQAWAATNGCDLEPVVQRVTPRIDRSTWEGCERGADVVLYSLVGAGHVWPGSDLALELEPFIEALYGEVTDEIGATAQLWRFFRDHPHPG